LAGILGLTLVAALVVLVLQWRSAHEESALRRAGEDAVVAARSAAVALTSYDYRTLAADHRRVAAAGTARFRSYYQSVSASTAKAVRALHVTAKGSVVAAAPDVEDADHVRVLLFVDQRVTSARGGTRVEQPRLSMAMVHEDGRWLVDSVALENSGS
jgi:Mce-associated membrane protein